MRSASNRTGSACDMRLPAFLGFRLLHPLRNHRSKGTTTAARHSASSVAWFIILGGGSLHDLLSEGALLHFVEIGSLLA